MAVTDVATQVGNRPIGVGTVISQVARTIGRFALPYYAVALIFAALNCVQFLTSSMPKGPTLTIINAVVVGTQLLGGMIAWAALTYATVEAIEGRPFSPRAGLAVGLRRFFLYLGAVILLYLAVTLSLLLLVVPAAIAFCVYSQAPVLAVIERTGPIASQSRSRQLTRNNRWRILAVVLVVSIPSLVTIGALVGYSAFAGFTAAAAGRQQVAALAGQLVGVQVAIVAFNFLLAPISYAWPAVLYHHLLRAEGSGGLGGVADVFA